MAFPAPERMLFHALSILLLFLNNFNGNTKTKEFPQINSKFRSLNLNEINA